MVISIGGVNLPGSNHTLVSAPAVGGGLTSGQVGNIVDDAIADHELDPTPHAAYDDLPDLALIYHAATV